MKGSVNMANLELSKLSQIEQLLNCLLALAKQNENRQNLTIVTQKELLNILQISPNTLKSWREQDLIDLNLP